MDIMETKLSKKCMGYWLNAFVFIISLVLVLLSDAIIEHNIKDKIVLKFFWNIDILFNDSLGQKDWRKEEYF